MTPHQSKKRTEDFHIEENKKRGILAPQFNRFCLCLLLLLFSPHFRAFFMLYYLGGYFVFCFLSLHLSYIASSYSRKPCSNHSLTPTPNLPTNPAETQTPPTGAPNSQSPSRSKAAHTANTSQPPSKSSSPPPQPPRSGPSDSNNRTTTATKD